MKKEKNTVAKNDKKLTTKELQDAVLKLLRSNPGKKYSARHIIDILKVGNNRDAIKYALEQIYTSGLMPPPIYKEKNSEKNSEEKKSEKNIFRKNSRENFSEKNSEEKKIENDSQENIFKKNSRENFSEKNIFKKNSEKNSTRFDDSGNFKNSSQNSGYGSRRATYEGIVDMTKTGSAYIKCADLEDDVFVPEKFLNSALDGDTVQVSVYHSQKRRRPDGEVLKVLKRGKDHFIGTLRFVKNIAIVMPDNLGVPNIVVQLDDTKEAQEGEKVVAQVTEWFGTKRSNRLTGIVTAVLGKPGSSDIEMKSILINRGFNIEFPADVLAESEKIHDEISSEVPHRRDFRGITTFTIDPVDAKDFDDALSFQVLENGNIEIGVHIADVTHYLKPDTALDREAYLRSTSVYLVDRVCPMLPERLSNELCSLRPFEDKLTFSAVFEFDDKYKVVKKWFGKTIIHSVRRYSYEEAQTVLETGEGDFSAELLKMNVIAYSLRKKRFKNGAINFETEEVRFRLDIDGVPIEVYVKERKDSNLLIEDYMLLANKEVAEFMAKRVKGIEVPYIYRVHDTPDIDKLAELALFAKELGFRLNFDSPQNIAKSLNDLALKAETDDTLKVLTPLAIRCMAKAVYSTNNIGHYGLAFDFYSHFTSPIRRYSDVLAHRILFENLGAVKRYDKEKLELQCKHISDQEKKAAECERESVRYKQVEFIKNKVGEVFVGVVTGMIERGIFVQLTDIFAEGMVSFSRCPEPFQLETSRLKATGMRSGKILKIGQIVRVQIVDADLENRRIDMRLVEF